MLYLTTVGLLIVAWLSLTLEAHLWDGPQEDEGVHRMMRWSIWGWDSTGGWRGPQKLWCVPKKIRGSIGRWGHLQEKGGGPQMEAASLGILPGSASSPGNGKREWGMATQIVCCRTGFGEEGEWRSEACLNASLAYLLLWMSWLLCSHEMPTVFGAGKIGSWKSYTWVSRKRAENRRP